MTVSALSDLASAYAVGPVATQEALGRWLADEVEVRHEPPEPADGVYPAAVVLQALAQRVALFTQVVPDYAETAELTENGDEITVALTIGGAAVRVQGVDVLTLLDGRIVRISSSFDAEQMKSLIELIQRAR